MAFKETVGKPDLSLIPLSFFENLDITKLNFELNETPIDILHDLHLLLSRKKDDFEDIRNRIVLMYFKPHTDKNDIYRKYADLLTEIAQVMQFGTIKYARENWALGGSVIKLLTACERHLLTWSYDSLDKESGQSHLAHALCNISFLLFYKSRPDLWELNDDRTFIYISNNN